MRVLVTRPEPGASRTAARLREMGFEPVVLPLSETSPLPVPGDAVPAEAAAVAVTSANALRHAPSGLIDRLTALPCYAVGSRTSAIARAAGFTNVVQGIGDATGLADEIGKKLAGKILVYLCGRERFPGFEERLAATAIEVDPIETYDTVSVDYSDAAVLSCLSDKSVDALLLYSVKAAEKARNLMARPALARAFRKTRVLTLSNRIGAAFGQNVQMAAKPDENALLALLTDAG